MLVVVIISRRPIEPINMQNVAIIRKNVAITDVNADQMVVDDCFATFRTRHQQ
jgi:hypothetical protein